MSLYMKEQIETPWGPHTRYREADSSEILAAVRLLANGERVESDYEGYKAPNRKGVRHQVDCLHDEPGVTICSCEPRR